MPASGPAPARGGLRNRELPYFELGAEFRHDHSLHCPHDSSSRQENSTGHLAIIVPEMALIVKPRSLYVAFFFAGQGNLSL
jgi:hypothetical protein